MDNINYNVKPNYNDLMNAYTRSLKVSFKHSLPPVPPVPPAPVRPTMTITSTTVESGDATDDSQINLTFTSSENTTDFISSDVQISGGTISNFTGSGKVYTAVFTPPGYATYTISVLANSFTDDSGNGNVASNEFVWTYTDTVKPTMTITSTTVESGESTDNSQINLTFTSSEDTTDFISSDIQISGGTSVILLDRVKYILLYLHHHHPVMLLILFLFWQIRLRMVVEMEMLHPTSLNGLIRIQSNLSQVTMIINGI